MKFEQLLQIYWSRGFLYGGKVKNFNVTLCEFFFDKKGLATASKRNIIKRFELNYYLTVKTKLLTDLSLEKRKIMNMYLSQIISINNNIFELIKYNFIRLYLIKTYRGRCFILGKPSKGQRTWSNASTAFKCNRTIRLFIQQVKKNNFIEKKPKSLNLKVLKKKKKVNTPKIKMVFIKKKKNLWF